MKRYFSKKGFTLVECVVAIAVFAIMSSMVMIIMSSAVTTAKKSSDAERDLNGLVQNVEDSHTHYTYTDGSDEFKMKFGGDSVNYSITYSKSTGYKEYITCPYPDCGYYGNFSEFLFNIPTTEQYKKVVAANGNVDYYSLGSYFYPHKDKSWWYPIENKDDPLHPYIIDGKGVPNDKTNQELLDKFYCPSCKRLLAEKSKVDTAGGEYAARDFKCYTCFNTGSPYDDAYFKYNRATCSFYCAKCGSANVMEEFAHDELGAGSEYSVNGIYSNAIRYGSVEKPDATKCRTLVQLFKEDGTETTGGVKTITITKPALSSGDYVYDFYIDIVDCGTFKMKLPPGYKIPVSDYDDVLVNKKFDNTTSATVDSDNTLIITRCKGGGSQHIRFSLVNAVNGSPFDYDYQAEGGLFGYWFRINDTQEGTGLNTFTVPRKLFIPEEASN